MSWEHLVGLRKYSLPFSHADSKSFRASTSSGLFFSYGSTTSIFSLYFLSNILKLAKLCLIYSESFLTAIDLFVDTVLETLSAEKRISDLRSSRPLPLVFATELIFPNFSATLSRSSPNYGLELKFNLPF
jgi:hypothetical protein